MLTKIWRIQASTDAALEKMNSLIAMKRGLLMTVNELAGLGVDMTDMSVKIKEMDQSISAAATGYMAKRIVNDADIQTTREAITTIDIGGTVESPIDFSVSKVLRLPLSSDSIKMDVQYFSFGSNEESSRAAVVAIENAIKESTADLGINSGTMAKTAGAQINLQRKNHSLAGTLIITASCTHRNVALIEPLTFDVDKAVALWNNTCTDGADRMNPGDPKSMNARAESTQMLPDANAITVISGVSYGSSFVGMVHVLNSELTGTGPVAEQTAQLQDRLKLGGWLENAAGGFGLDESIADEVRKLLSTQSVSSHVSVIVMGAVPSIVSNQLKMGVEKWMDTGLNNVSGQIATLENESSPSNETMQTGASKAQNGGRILRMQGSMMQNMMQGLGKIDQTNNKVLDINSMMAAFENYLQAIKEKEGTVGVPVNFYLKTISSQQIAQLWMDKYFPDPATMPAVNPGKLNDTA